MGYIAFSQSFLGKKIAIIHDSNSDVTVGVTGSGYDEWYRYPASFLIPEGDPQFSKEGNTALGEYGYMLNSRCWTYDIGLALLVFATAKEWEIVIEILNRLKMDQNSDGSWNFSYDIYIGKLFHDYIRTGSVGWVVWGICYAVLQLGTFYDDKYGYKEMLKKAGDWVLSKQVTDTTDPRYGLLKGGHGIYDYNYRYTDEEIEWCSTEHQCSSLQALEGLALVFNDQKYIDAAELIRDQLYYKCYDFENKRFYQGIPGSSPDKAWALDCTTWAGTMLFSIVNSESAKDCYETAKSVYRTDDKSIVQSKDKSHYNMTYFSDDVFSGFKPYSDKTPDYKGCPDIVWSEGTLGFALLAYVLGQQEECVKYIDEVIKLQNCNGSTGGVLYVNETYADMPWEFHTWESMVSSAWLYLIINNPSVLFPRTFRRIYYMVKSTNIDDERP